MNTQPPTPILQLSNLNVYYGESHIIRNVDLSVSPGLMVCLIGRNGVGKTTLLKTVMGVLDPRQGQIRYQDQPITQLPSHRRAQLGIGYVPQGRDIIPRVTVKENLLLGMEALSQRRPGSETPRDKLQGLLFDRVFDLFPVLNSMLNRMGGDLSGGQQQQLAIARALMGNPQLLVLDEPTEGIQPSIILEIEAAVRRLITESNMSVLLVEQHLHFVRQADYYYAMQRGGIVASGPTAELSQAVIQEFLSV